MARKRKKQITFVEKEIILSFLGALILAAGVLILSGAFLFSGWTLYLFGVLVIWLGLIIFAIPIIRKIEARL